MNEKNEVRYSLKYLIHLLAESEEFQQGYLKDGDSIHLTDSEGNRISLRLEITPKREHLIEYWKRHARY